MRWVVVVVACLASDDRVAFRRSLPEGIAAFQRLGFFAGADPERLARRIQRRHRADWGESLRLRTIYDELELTRYDRRRVWFEDTEADVLEGNDAYVAFLRDLARISRGTFAPTRISERWEGGDVEISFTHAGRQSGLVAADLTDFLDLCVVPQINRSLPRRGPRFAVFKPFDQTAYVVALTARERTALQDEHGWQFARRAELRQPAGDGGGGKRC